MSWLRTAVAACGGWVLGSVTEKVVRASACQFS